MKLGFLAALLLAVFGGLLFLPDNMGFLSKWLHSDKEPDFYLGGIKVDEPDQAEWVKQLQVAGMNTVSVTVYARQPEWNSPKLWFDRQDTSIISEIRAAKARGLAVVLVLRVFLDHKFVENHFLWHGMIMPTTDEDLETWFSQYGRFVEHWSRIAAAESVDLLSIGSELRQLTATAAVDTMPQLLEYYNNPKKLARTKGDLLAFETHIEDRHLWTRGRGNYASLAAYIDAKQEAESSWSAQVSHLAAPDPLGQIKRRRQLLKKHWHRLIAQVRQHYRGQVGYAANFDNYMAVDFWDQLDFIGINAYFKLRTELGDSLVGDPLVEHLTGQWNRILSQIDSVRTAKGVADHPVIFTEIGYTYRKFSTIYPWTGGDFAVFDRGLAKQMVIMAEQPVDFVERSQAIEALYRAHQGMETRLKADGKAPLLKGLLYWKFSTQSRHLLYEPFMVWIGPQGADPSVKSLQRFTSSENSLTKDDPSMRLADTGKKTQQTWQAIELALGNEAWSRTGALKWSQRGLDYVWDHKRHYVKVVWEDKIVLLDLVQFWGLVSTDGGQSFVGGRGPLVQQAWQRWRRDGFGLWPLRHVAFPWVEQRQVQRADGGVEFQLVYYRGEDAPYHWPIGAGSRWVMALDQKFRPRQARLSVFYPTPKTQEVLWEDWTVLSTGVWVPQVIVSDGEVQRLSAFAAAADLADLFPQEDPFAPLEADTAALESPMEPLPPPPFLKGQDMEAQN